MRVSILQHQWHQDHRYPIAFISRRLFLIGPPLISCILSLDATPLRSWGYVQENTTTGRGLSSAQIEEYVVFSILSSVAIGDTAVVQAFLNAGLEQDSPLQSSHDRVESSLERAVTTNQLTMARFLLSRGADSNAEPLESVGIPCTMLSYAASFGLSGMVRLLVSEEGRGRLVRSWALWRAAEISSFDVAETLLDLGVDVNEVFIRPQNRGVRAADNCGTALHAAFYEDKLKFVEWLLRKGINPELKSGYGQTVPI